MENTVRYPAYRVLLAKPLIGGFISWILRAPTLNPPVDILRYFLYTSNMVTAMQYDDFVFAFYWNPMLPITKRCTLLRNNDCLPFTTSQYKCIRNSSESSLVQIVRSLADRITDSVFQELGGEISIK